MIRINKQKALIAQQKKVFHTQDLAVIWGISDKNALYVTIDRFKKRGILIPIFKGYYATFPLNKIDPWEIGTKAMHGFCYVSCETILAKEGLINAIPRYITLVGKKTWTVEIGENTYRCRQLRDSFLFQSAGILEKGGVYYASVPRAIADMHYYNPHFHWDAPIDRYQSEVADIQSAVGYIRG
jgi:predicted transcriptional regulator of viral defense system